MPRCDQGHAVTNVTLTRRGIVQKNKLRRVSVTKGTKPVRFVPFVCFALFVFFVPPADAGQAAVSAAAPSSPAAAASTELPFAIEGPAPPVLPERIAREIGRTR